MRSNGIISLLAMSALSAGLGMTVRHDPERSPQPIRNPGPRGQPKARITNPGNGAGAERQRARLAEKEAANRKYYANAVWAGPSRQVMRRSYR